MPVPKKLRVLKVPTLEICEGLGTKLTRNPLLKDYSIKYITRDVVRQVLKKTLVNVEVACCAKWNEEKQQWEGNLNYKEESYQWNIKEA